MGLVGPIYVNCTFCHKWNPDETWIALRTVINCYRGDACVVVVKAHMPGLCRGPRTLECFQVVRVVRVLCFQVCLRFHGLMFLGFHVAIFLSMSYMSETLLEHSSTGPLKPYPMKPPAAFVVGFEDLVDPQHPNLGQKSYS